jgi:hypothetical protein
MENCGYLTVLSPDAEQIPNVVKNPSKVWENSNI